MHVTSASSDGRGVEEEEREEKKKKKKREQQNQRHTTNNVDNVQNQPIPLNSDHPKSTTITLDPSFPKRSQARAEVTPPRKNAGATKYHTQTKITTSRTQAATNKTVRLKKSSRRPGAGEEAIQGLQKTETKTQRSAKRPKRATEAENTDDSSA